MQSAALLKKEGEVDLERVRRIIYWTKKKIGPKMTQLWCDMLEVILEKERRKRWAL